LQADNGVTIDAARVLRMPGTHNRKDPQSPKQVHMVWCKPALSVDDLASKLNAQLAGDIWNGAPAARFLGLVNNDDLSASAASSTMWFDELPSERRINEACAMVRALPSSEADERDSWISVLAEIQSLKIPDHVKDDISWEFSRRSPKSARETPDSVAATRRQLGSRTNVNALLKRALAYGYRPPGAPTATAFNTVGEAIGYLTRTYAFVSDADCYFNLLTRQPVAKRALSDLESWRMPRTESGGRAEPLALLRGSAGVLRCDSVGYHPGGEATYREEGRLLANLFVPYSPEPVKPTLAERKTLIKFLRHLFPRGSELVWLRHLLDTFAFLVQNPGERVKYTMILVGAVEGSGKSTLMERVPRLLFGGRNVVTASMNEIASNFTDYLARAWIVVFAEMSVGNYRDSQRIANAMKDNQTNDITRIHPKGRAAYSQRNRASFLATSNDEVHAMHLSEFDRRAGINVTRAPKIPVRLERDLFSLLNDPQRGPGVLRYIALRRQISLNPNAAPPMTEAKRGMIESSRDDCHAAIVDAWSSGEFPFDGRDLVTVQDVSTMLRGKGIDTHRISERRIAECLRRAPMNAEPLPGSKRIKGRRVIPGIYSGIDYGVSQEKYRVWAIRDSGIWRGASEASISQHILRGTAAPISAPTLQVTSIAGTSSSSALRAAISDVPPAPIDLHRGHG
jgi:hypothetical protein